MQHRWERQLQTAEREGPRIKEHANKLPDAAAPATTQITNKSMTASTN